MQTTGIIVAGGKSSRMGTNKALLNIGGKTVIERIASELRKTVSNLIIVTNSFEEYRFLGLPMVEDQWKDSGPLAGLHAGLTASHSDKNLVVACDMPFISAQFGGILLSFLEEHQAAVPYIAGQLHPLFAAYRKETAEEINQSLHKQELRIRQFYGKIKTKLVTEADLAKFPYRYQEKHLFNMNQPEEFKKAVEMEEGLGE